MVEVEGAAALCAVLLTKTNGARHRYLCLVAQESEWNARRPPYLPHCTIEHIINYVLFLDIKSYNRAYLHEFF